MPPCRPSGGRRVEAVLEDRADLAGIDRAGECHYEHPIEGDRVTTTLRLDEHDLSAAALRHLLEP
jgi:hypothetical protein